MNSVYSTAPGARMEPQHIYDYNKIIQYYATCNILLYKYMHKYIRKCYHLKVSSCSLNNCNLVFKTVTQIICTLQLKKRQMPENMVKCPILSNVNKKWKK